MLLYRSLSLGFLGACLLLLATRPPVVVEHAGPACGQTSQSHIRACPPIPQGPTILDVASYESADDLARMFHLGNSEYIAAVDDTPVPNTLGAGVELARLERDGRLGPGRFVDLDVRGPAGERRLLVLMH
jgi:hypothetical protein